ALAATVAVSVLSWRALPSAQTGPGIEPSVPRQDVMKDLLVEVRGLRAAIEQMAGAGPRIQLAMGRLQLQEQRVNTYLRQLETVRESLRVKTDHLADIRRELGGLET